jgi:hypothetical protein
MTRISRKLVLSLGLSVGLIALSACEPVPGSSANVRAGVYYDSLMWNDYYYGYGRPGYRPRPDLPDRPARPDRPVDPGFSRPGRPIDPGFSRPSRPSVPHHRPAGGGPRGRR